MKKLKHDMINSRPPAVADRVKRFIAHHALQPGDRLPTHDVLSKHLGIGLRRLREALSILEQQGLIVTARKAGTRIAQPTVEALHDPIAWHLDRMGYTFEDLVRARASTEGAVAAEAARKRTARNLLAMLDAIERMEAVVNVHPRAEAADEAFHMAVLHAAHNPVMLIFGQLIAQQFRRKAQEHLGTSRRYAARGLAEHKVLFAAIETRDAETARREMYNHILRQLEEKRPNRKRARPTKNKSHEVH
jgi:DNA-binding FadR family transcriptional regulator